MNGGPIPSHPLHQSLIIIVANVNGYKLQAMVDTGATATFIKAAVLHNIKHTHIIPTRTKATLADGHSALVILGLVNLLVKINHVPTYVRALVAENLATDMILGMDWCSKNSVEIRPRRKEVVVYHKRVGKTTARFNEEASVIVELADKMCLQPYEERVVRVTLPLSSAQLVCFEPDVKECARRAIASHTAILAVENCSSYVLLFNRTNLPNTIRKGTKLGSIHYMSNRTHTHCLFDNRSRKIGMTDTGSEFARQPDEVGKVIDDLTAHIINEQDRSDFLNILYGCRQAFDTSKATQARITVHHTIPTGDARPTSVRPFHKTPQQREVLHKEVRKLLEDNVVRESTSPWASPVILKKKPDGTYRFLVDFRRLNAVTKKDAYPQPTTEELLNRLAGHRFFTKLDLKSGYFQIPISEVDKEKTAFVTQDGLYEFNVLAQGLMNAPPTFQRVMNNLIATGRWNYVVVYLDDILIFSDTIAEHKKHVAEVLSILQKARFQVSPSKCVIAVTKIEFLSHIITAAGMEPSPDKIQAVLDIPSPKTLTQANRFIGKIGYYRKFVKDFANIAAPIHKVTNKTGSRKSEFFWAEEQQLAFEKFKEILTTPPLFLNFPEISTPFILSTDASKVRVGGVLKQMVNGVLKVNYYLSRLLSETESRYSTTEREALAIMWCLDKLRYYMGDSLVTIETDHKPLVNFHKKLNFGSKRVDSYLLKMQDMLPQIVEINYKPGKDNNDADYMTRQDEQGRDETADWPQGTETWDDEVVGAVSTRSRAQQPLIPIKKTSVLRTPTVLHVPPETASPRATAIDLSFSQIRQRQADDNEVRAIVKQLKDGTKSDLFCIQDNILFRLVRRKGRIPMPKIPYLPASLIHIALNAFHDHPLSGHFGVRRTLDKLKTRYWWPHMQQAVKQYIGSCDQCARHNIKRTKEDGKLKNIDPPDDVFQLVHMDFWGPMPASDDDNRYVLVLTDNLSKYVIAEAFPDCTAKTAAKFFVEKFILIHGAPERLITDNGGHFSNALMKTITQTIGVQHAFSVSYHPQTNGQVERFNATFATQLAKYCNEEKSDWDVFLQQVVSAYNTGVHATTGFAPYELAFGRKLKSPFDPTSKIVKIPRADEFYKYLQRSRTIIIKAACENIRQQQHLSKQRYDVNRKDMSYNIGDLVYVKVFADRHKLDERWVGPFEIIERHGDQNYLVNEQGTERKDRCHVSQLRPVLERRLRSH